MAIFATAGWAVVLSAAAPALAAPARDSADGSALNQYPTLAGPGMSRLTVSARLDNNGDPAGIAIGDGTTFGPRLFLGMTGAFRVQGAVTCLTVRGNQASIKYRFDKASGSAAAFQGGGIQVYVEDNRTTGAPDANAFQNPEPMGVFDPGNCGDPTLADYDPVESGNYTVRDGTVGLTG